MLLTPLALFLACLPLPGRPFDPGSVSLLTGASAKASQESPPDNAVTAEGTLAQDSTTSADGKETLGNEPVWLAVRTLLDSKCLSCHGGKAVKGGLRLATAETFLAGGNRGPVFNADDPGESRLLHAVSYRDPELSMPPTGQLDEAELALLAQWIKAGAAWPEGTEGQLANPEAFTDQEALGLEDGANWWSYRPLLDPAVPNTERSHSASSGNDIDAYIDARQSEAGLQPAGSASPHALLRRATFDLTGLPPKPMEIANFAADVNARGFDVAWGELLNRLLASPAYGEHWARHWLDLVRYADTNGYERDTTKKNMWRYRDWVIRSFNSDKPYDRFVIEQLAGDELAQELGGVEQSDDAAEALLGTGFYRLMVFDDEPPDRVQASADQLADVVDTTGQVFMGMMVGCARCHDHKADPITQRDYYSLTAFFNNMEGYKLNATTLLADPPGPGVLTLQERNNLLDANEEVLARFAEKLGVIDSVEHVEDFTVLVGDAREEAATWDYLVEEAPDGWETPGFDSTTWGKGQAGFGPQGARQIGSEWKSPLIQLRTRFALTSIPRSAVLSIRHDEDAEVFLNGELIQQRNGFRADYIDIQLGPDEMRAFVVGSNVLAVRCKQTVGGQHIDVGLKTGWLPGEDGWLAQLGLTLAERAEPGTAEPVPVNKDPFDSDPENQDLAGPDYAGDATAAARVCYQERKRIESTPYSEPYPANVTAEKDGSGPSQHILLRGSAHAKGSVVPPEIPSVVRHVLGNAVQGVALPAGTGTHGRRLAFARWLMDEGALLSARVMANRLWQFHFGRGLCPSPGDFGRLGIQPTHPLLLDHLANQLVEDDWSLKSMHRYIMSSAAYQRASEGPAEASESDPLNNYFWRFNPRRLTAEEYRDAVLATNGTLNRELHGPGVYPPMPQEALASSSRPQSAWGRSTDEQAARRSLYIFVKRSLRMPLMESFDQPDPDLPCPERFPTNVPTQALLTMNGDFTAKGAADLATRLRSDEGFLAQQVARGIYLTMGRDPGADEVARSLDFIASLIAEHALSEEDALRFFCLSLYNQNEFLWVD